MLKFTDSDLVHSIIKHTETEGKKYDPNVTLPSHFSSTN